MQQPIPLRRKPAQHAMQPHSSFPVSRSLPPELDTPESPSKSQAAVLRPPTDASSAIAVASAPPRSPFVDASCGSCPDSLNTTFLMDEQQQEHKPAAAKRLPTGPGGTRSSGKLAQPGSAQTVLSSLEQAAGGDEAEDVKTKPAGFDPDASREAADRGRGVELRIRTSAPLLARHSSQQQPGSRTSSLDLGMMPPREMQVCRAVMLEPSFSAFKNHPQSLLCYGRESFESYLGQAHLPYLHDDHTEN